MRTLRTCQMRPGIVRRKRATRQRKLKEAAAQRAATMMRVALQARGHSSVFDKSVLPGYVIDVPVKRDGTLDLSDVALVRRHA